MSAGIIAAGIGAVGAIYSANKSASAAKSASNTQAAAAQAGIDEQRRQYDNTRELLNPYVNAGVGSLGSLQNALGVNGNSAQNAFYQQLQNSPAYAAMLKQGNNAILQNASATGGLRGGNTQAALAQFAPNLLNNLAQQQIGQFGSLVSLGQNAAAGVGNAGMQTGNNIANLLGQQGAAQAGGALGVSNAYGGLAANLTNLAGYGLKQYQQNQQGGQVAGTAGALGNGGIGTSNYSLSGMGAKFGGDL